MIIKHLPEDFVVEEELALSFQKEGRYFYYRIKKVQWNTLDFVKILQEKLHTKDVGYAGLKDKHAVTTQYISVPKEIRFSLPNVEVAFLGRGDERIHLGMHSKNHFQIVVRGLDQEMAVPQSVINFFGEQRFSKENAKFGKLLLQKKYRELCAALGRTAAHNDFLGALLTMKIPLLRLFLYAYQSQLWNRLAAVSDKEVVPLLGFLTEGDDYDGLCQEEGINKELFQMRQIPALAMPGGARKRVLCVENPETLTFTDDPLFVGKKMQCVRFSLPKGAYATVVLSQLVPLHTMLK